MYKKIIIICLISACSFLIFQACEEKFSFKRNTHTITVYSNEELKKTILNNHLYTWLHNQTPVQIQKIKILGDLANIKVIGDLPEVNYEKSFYREDSLYTSKIFQCVGVAITATHSDFLKKYLFHFNFFYRDNIKKNKHRLSKILHKLNNKGYEIEIGISSVYYSSNVFELLSLIKKSKNTITHIDIDPFYCCDPLESYFINKINLFLLDPSFLLNQETVNHSKNLMISTEGAFFNASLPEDISKKLIENVYQDRQMWYYLRFISPVVLFDIIVFSKVIKEYLEKG